MKTIIVTGSMGYVGKNLCKILLSAGYSIIQIDKTIEEDVVELDNIYDAYAIVHLAALPSIKLCQLDSEAAIHDNILATTNIAKLASAKNIPIIFASSQAAKDPSSSLYAFSKAACEKILQRFTNTTILRFSNIYGGEDFFTKDTVISRFLRTHKAGEELEIYGDGTQTRDFIHMYDICTAILLALQTEPWKSTDEPIDIGTGIETSIADLAFMISHLGVLTGNHDDKPVGIKRNVANTKAMLHFLSFAPVRDLKKEIEYLKESINKNVT